jgi:hypothetical protein
MVNIWDWPFSSDFDKPHYLVSNGQDLMLINSRTPFGQDDMYAVTSDDTGQTWAPTPPLSEYQGTMIKHRYPSAVAGPGSMIFVALFRGDINTDDSHILFYRSDTWGSDWSSPDTVSQSSVALPNYARQQVMGVSLDRSESGGLYVAWASVSRNSDGTDNFDIYMSHSTDDGDNWSDETLIAADQSLSQHYPALAVTGGGDADTVLITWHQARSPVGISDAPSISQHFQLAQNYPNPFNPVTHIRYSLPEAGNVVLTIYDITGRAVRTLTNNRQAAGEQHFVWNGRSDSGREVASGLYFYRLLLQTADGRAVSKTRKMLKIE